RDRMVGIDMSRGMLEVCRKRTADAPGSAAIELVRGNVLAMPFGQEFDLALCMGALGHILSHDEPRFVSEVARVLKPGGRFAFVTSYQPPWWSSRYWMARSFNAAMRVRNFLLTPPFIMYYLTFLLPDVLPMLEEHGFQPEVRDLAVAEEFSRLR